MSRPKKYPDINNTGSVYMFKNINNGKIYIGSAKKTNSRISNHIFLLNNNKHHSIHFQRAWNQKDSYFVCGIIEKVWDNTKLIEIEQKYMDKYKSANGKYGYNICPIARNNLGSKHQKGRIEKSIRMTGEGNNFFGKKHTKETLKLISLSNFNRKLTNDDVLEIKYLYESDTLSQGKIAKQYGVSQSHISRIINNINRKILY